MRISITQSKVNLGSYQKQISKELRIALVRAGLLAKQMILQRTKSGQGVDGSFKAYSDSYKKERQEKGLPTKPDLFVTGAMLGAMQNRVKADYAELYFISGEQNKKAFFNDKIRPFFDLNDKEKQRIRKLFRIVK
jgi:hypothetical protein